VTHTEAGSDRPESGVCVTRLVITAWLPVPLYELRSLLSLAAGFHASLTVWFGADLVSGGLEEGGPSSRQSNGEDAGSLDAGQVRTTRRMSMTLGRTCLSPLSSNLPVASLR
jgi:hypothetical protein